MEKNRHQGGVTLLELMIVVVIVGILAAIAYPAYQEQVRKARRADAVAALMQFAIVMERMYTEENTYRPGGVNPVLGTGNAGAIFPDKSPLDGNDRFYTLSFGAITNTSYQLNAAPQNIQANDRCGTLTLTNTGMKGQKAGMSIDDCW